MLGVTLPVRLGNVYFDKMAAISKIKANLESSSYQKCNILSYFSIYQLDYKYLNIIKPFRYRLNLSGMEL